MQTSVRQEHLRASTVYGDFSFHGSFALPKQITDEFRNTLARVEIFFEEWLDFAGDDFPIPGFVQRMPVGWTKETMADAESGAKVALFFDLRIQRSHTIMDASEHRG